MEFDQRAPNRGKRKGSMWPFVLAASMLAVVLGPPSKHHDSDKKAGLPVQLTKEEKAYLASINKFRDDVNKRHRAAIALGVCVGWPNAEDGITVTWNPGVTSLNTSKEDHKLYYMWSGVDKSTKPPTIVQMDGPDLDNTAAMPLMASRHSSTKGTNVNITPRAFHDTNGQMYYRDSETGTPIMDTVVIPDVTPELGFLSGVCDALREHKPIPSVPSDLRPEPVPNSMTA